MMGFRCCGKIPDLKTGYDWRCIWPIALYWFPVHRIRTRPHILIANLSIIDRTEVKSVKCRP